MKWEYCVIAAEKVGFMGLKRLIYFFDEKAPGGMRKEVFLKKYTPTENVRDIDFDAPIIARLGIEGWELFYIDPQSNWKFFKRKVIENS